VVEPPSGVLYADTSALVKLAVNEAQSGAVERELSRWDVIATSEITTIELPRALERARSDGRAEVADGRLVLELLAALSILPLTDDIRALAASTGPVELRTLDAIHLASAVILDEDLAAVLTYDHRLAEAAVIRGLQVIAPS
jgi:uncharacterized protein